MIQFIVPAKNKVHRDKLSQGGVKYVTEDSKTLMIKKKTQARSY